VPALSHPILIEQGATFTLQTKVEVGAGTLDVTAPGYSALFTVNKSRRPLPAPVLSLSTASGGNEIVFSAGGLVTVTASSFQTRSISFVPGRTYRYRLDLTAPDGAIFRLLKGRAVLSPTPGSPVVMTITTELGDPVTSESGDPIASTIE